MRSMLREPLPDGGPGPSSPAQRTRPNTSVPGRMSGETCVITHECHAVRYSRQVTWRHVYLMRPPHAADCPT